MYNKDAKELRKTVNVGTLVTVIEGPYGQFGTGFRTLDPGDRGADVYAIQMKLKELGYYPNWVDGIYGTTMQVAITKFQKDKKLTVTKYIRSEFYAALGIELFE